MSDLQLHQSYQTTREVVASAAHFVRRLMSRWWLLLPAFVLAAAAAVIGPRFVHPIFSSQMTLMYRNTVTAESVLVGRQRPETWRDKSARYRDLVFTRSNLERIVTQLELYPEIVAERGLVAATEQLRADLEVSFPSGTTIALTYKSTDKSKLLPVLQRIEQSFKDQPVQDSVEEAKATKRFLEKQYTTAGEELAKKESELASFVANHPEFSEASKGGMGTLTRALQKEGSAPSASGVSRRGSLNRQIARLEARLAALDGKPSSSAAPEAETRIVPEDQQRIDAAKRVVGTAQERLSQLKDQFTAAHPDVIAGQSELRKAEVELQRVQNSARRETLPDPGAPPVQDSPAARADLQAQIARLKSELARTPAQPASASKAPTPEKPAANDFVESVVALETEWAALQRDVSNAREQHASIGQRLFQADTVVKLVSNAGTGQIVTLDAAFEPTTPVAKSALSTALKLFVAVLGLGVLLAAALTALDDRLYREQDLRSSGGSVIVATIPHASPVARR